MERESNPMQALCRSGCGFYGSPATDGLCSLCFKENLKKKQQLPTAPSSLSALRDTTMAQPTFGHLQPSPVTDLSTKTSEESSNQSPAQSSAAADSAAAESIAAEAAAAVAASADSDAGSEDKDGEKDSKKKKNRCHNCRKKVGLTGFQCRCGNLFCAIHRYSDKHDCSFNYREMGAQEIRRNNPVVVGEKIQKI
nr:AN1-type zinc finger protein 6 isoform X1 [Leptinotarsa decemlineata]XP_023011548.1 AN1-type zinc finger protein 6 isoform X1 [Leptinotarsa decemlineata]XP_023011549.1 AN1-type zinc finger protein 6 isoform X1 [Leptinotarsa decemlineata]